eukprot:TRINITY_DN4208_c0_g1_i10.p2 TRINITY_DN4208_c0_g1~~TRINITY_DN4208_c0_g1_i10.p2  ORF type:complete len:269 (+),score=51.09 TRINITY_DN4208_c0_g1_i10:558-1364(+)
MLMPPIRETEVLAVNLVSRRGGVLILDAGVNGAGYARVALTAGAAPGAEIRLGFGEVLDLNGSLVNPLRQEDRYIYSGAELNGTHWIPKFVYHGFRYLELKVSGLVGDLPHGCAAQQLVSCIQAVMIRSDLLQTSRLTLPGTRTATVLSKIHTSVLQTQKSNLHSVPTDCPQREKRGWMGDAQWSAEEATLNMDTMAFYLNWLQTMADMQAKRCVDTHRHFRPLMEPPYGSCCVAPVSELHPTQFDCSPMSDVADTSGSVPDLSLIHI